jgi:hypothetical protein
MKILCFGERGGVYRHRYKDIGLGQFIRIEEGIDTAKAQNIRK